MLQTQSVKPELLGILRKYNYILLLYPIIVLWIVFEISTEQALVPERLFFLHSLLFLASFFIAKKSLRTAYIFTVYILTLVLLFFDAAYTLIYKEPFNYSIVYILLETNPSEMSEYLKVYFSLPILVLILAFIIPSFFILRVVKRTIYKYSIADYSAKIGSFVKNRKWILHIFLLLLHTSGTIVYVKAEHFNHHIINKFITGYDKYSEEMERTKEFLSGSSESPYLKSVEKKQDDKSETIIVIIGESTTKHNMGIYDYYRNTTPKLREYENSLVVFKDVISPYNNTILSLEKVLTFGSMNEPDESSKGSIVQLAKAAGYKTYWISNQIPIGFYETLVTLIGKAADESYFTNLGTEEAQKSHDESLFPFIDKALKDSSPKKVIFIHLLGTHSAYYLRYPKEFKQFTDEPQTGFKSSYVKSVINDYDNAILYNDFIVGSIISNLENSGDEKAEKQLIYFSDHGEEVFKSMYFEGHSEAIKSYPMFDIPFIYWSNQKDRIENYSQFADRKYMTDDFIYSFADLLDIKFNGRDDSKSVFSKSFQPKERIVREGLNFDTEIRPQK